jgi:hypothetical protein
LIFQARGAAAKMSKSKNFLVNGSLVLLSLSLSLLAAEFVVFRFILPASDFPALDFVDGVVKYRPNQTGIYRVRNQINSRYQINANGWNSAHPRYESGAPAGKYRIAVVGDSYVEALQVNFGESLAEQLEGELGNGRFEVYRFGISGAPLSQYLHILRREVAAYQPNLGVVILIHNDFNESYQYVRQGVIFASSFLKIKIANHAVAAEMPPQPFQKRWHTVLKERSATWRYLALRQQIRFQFLRDLVLEQNAEEAYQANITVSSLEGNRVDNELAANYVFREMKRWADERGIKLLLAMDGDRNAIYNNLNEAALGETGALSLNALAKKAAQQNGIDFIDLHPVFKDDFAQNHKMFNFEMDGHWNAYGHRVAANAIFHYIEDRRLIRNVDGQEKR